MTETERQFFEKAKLHDEASAAIRPVRARNYKRTFRNVVIALAFGIVVFLGILTFRPVVKVEIDETQSTSTNTFEVATFQRRWSGKPYWQEVTIKEGPKIVGTASGPTSETGLKHGKWTFNETGKPTEFVFMWYGKEVAEGKWHELSKE